MHLQCHCLDKLQQVWPLHRSEWCHVLVGKEYLMHLQHHCLDELQQVWPLYRSEWCFELVDKKYWMHLQHNCLDELQLALQGTLNHRQTKPIDNVNFIFVKIVHRIFVFFFVFYVFFCLFFSRENSRKIRILNLCYDLFNTKTY